MNELITIGVSHFCEKARWALDWADIAYTEHSHVALAHRIYARGSVPRLKTSDGSLTDSADILRYANRKRQRRDTATLFDDRGVVERLQAEFDGDLGPTIRSLMYCHLTKKPRLLMRMAVAGVPTWERRLVNVSPSLFAWVLAKIFRVSPTLSDTCVTRLRLTFDKVATRLNKSRSGYLVGDHFSAADLTFCALARPLFSPLDRAVLRGAYAFEEAPSSLQDILLEFTDHPIRSYVVRIYRDHRGTSS
jgi:glutathione S-transferase